MAECPEYNPYSTEETHQGGITKRLVVVIGFLAGAVGALLLSPTWGSSRLPASAFARVKDRHALRRAEANSHDHQAWTV